MHHHRLWLILPLAFVLALALLPACSGEGIESTAPDQAPAQQESAAQDDAQAQDQEQEQDQQQEEQTEIRQSAPPAFYDRVKLPEESFPYDPEKPLVGHWHGNIHTQFGWPAGMLLVEVGEDGEYRVSGSVTPGNRPHIELTTFTIDGRTIEFVFPLDPPEAGRMRLTGTVSEDGQRLAGELRMPQEWIKRALEVEAMARQEQNQPPLTEEEAQQIADTLRMGTFEYARVPRPIDLPNPAAYEGAIEVDPGAVFNVTLVVAETPGGHWVGHVDIPEHFVSGWLLDRVERDGDHMICHVGGGSVGTYDGVVSDDSQTYSGTYRQVELEIPFEFQRVAEYEVPHFDLPAGMGPPAFREVDATIEHPAGHTLGASLALPIESAGDEDAKYPAVILLSGQGPQNRSYTLFGRSIFDAMTDALTREGIAVLRYDDRGFGESTGQFNAATTADFASDAVAAFNWLKALDNIDADRIGFVGHDEGATAAAIATAELGGEAGFAILLSPRGLIGYEYDLAQLPAEIERVGLQDETLIEAYLSTARALLQAMVEGAEEERLQELALAAAQAQDDVARALGIEPSMPVQHSARIKVARLKQPWAAFHLSHDPAETLKKVEAPLLAIWGGSDQIADPDLNREPIETAAESGGGTIDVRIYDELNHLLQPGGGDGPDFYRRSPVDIDPQVLQDIAAWINDRQGAREEED